MAKKLGKTGARYELIVYKPRGSFTEAEMKELFLLLTGIVKTHSKKLKLAGTGDVVSVQSKGEQVIWKKI